MYYLILFGLALLPLPIVLLSLLPAWRFGRPSPMDERRRARVAIETAITLSILASPAPFLLFIGFGIVIVPAISFGIAAAVAGHAGRRPMVYGSLACPWFPLPLLFYWGFVSPPTELIKFAGLEAAQDSFSWAPIVLLWFSWWFAGVLGAGMATLILNRKRRPPVIAMPPGGSGEGR